jgi:hypothetical protein
VYGHHPGSGATFLAPSASAGHDACMAAVTGITSEPLRERPALTMLRKPAALRLTSSIGSAVLCGIVVGGIGGRIVMRVSALAADESRIGMITENGNIVGRITVEGTLALLLFVGLIAGVSVGLFLFALRTVLPGRFLPATISAVLLALGGAIAIDPGNVDFVILGNRALNVAMFIALFPAFGVSFVVIAERLERWLVRPPLARIAPLSLLGTGLGVVLGLLGVGVITASNGLPAGVAVVVVTALGAVTALAPEGPAAIARSTALVVLGISTAWGLSQVAQDVRTIVG